jgi:Transposase DDE domain
MLDRLVEIFCAMDDFCKAFFLQWAALQLSAGKVWERGPECGLSASEIMTIVVLYHGARYRYFKNYYNGVVLTLLKPAFPGLPSYERFIALKPRIFIPLLMFLASRTGRKTGIYYVDSTALPVCHNRRIARHKVFAGLAARGKTSMGWFCGFKLQLVFNHQHEIVALKLTPGNVSDPAPVISLLKGLTGKLFGDKGYIGKKLAATLLRQGLALMTKVRKNMKALPMTLADQLLLKARNMAETIIGQIKAFSSLNLPKHRSPLNAFIHLIAALTAYQLNPIQPNNPPALQLR